MNRIVVNCQNDAQRQFLHIDVPFELQLLSNLFHNAGLQLYLVGGAVRDTLLGREPKDFDVATDAHPDRIIELVSSIQGVTIIEVGKAFGVIKVVFHRAGGIFECEIATFRVDLGAGRRPDAVVFSTIEEDVKRRDLTINALFWDMYSHEVVDLVGGLDDIRDSIVRTVGRPEDRFSEDRLRILRTVRFAAQLGCELDPRTEDAIINDPSLVGVSAERIRDEFLKGLAKARSVTHFAVLLQRLGLWHQVLPGLQVRPDMVREIRHPGILLTLILKSNPILRDHGSFHLPNDLNQQSIEYVLHELKYTTDEIKQVVFLSRFTWLREVDAYKMKKAFLNSHLTQQDVEKYASIRRRPELAMVRAFFNYQPSVSAQALMTEGFLGKELGLELERREAVLFCQVLDAETQATIDNSN